MNRVVFCLIALLLLTCCENRLIRTRLDTAEAIIQSRPDSALAIIRAIDTTELSTRKLQARYALLHAIALDKNWIDTTDESVVMPAIHYYDRRPSDIRRAKAWYYLGRIQQNAGNHPDASISLLKAERYAEAFEDAAFKGLVYQSISSVYSQTHLHEEALKYTERAYSLFVEENNSRNASAALLCMAQDYYNLGRYAEADSLYRSLLENNNLHPNLVSDLLCSYALSCVIHREDYEQAIRLFEDALSSTGTLKNANSWGAYAYSLFRNGNTKRAEAIFKQLAAGESSSQRFVYNSWKSLADAFSEDYAPAYSLQKAATDIQNENVRKALRQSAIKAQKVFLEEMAKEAEKQAKRRQLANGGIIILFIVILSLLIFLYRRHIQQSSYEKAIVRHQYIRMYQSHFGHIGRINEMLHSHAKEADNTLYQELKASIQKVGSSDRDQQEFEKLLNDAFDNVMTHFRESFPNKKPRYYQLVSYLFAGFDTTTICIIIPNYSKHNIHVEKSRLKQRLLSSDSPHKDQFLQLLR